MLAVDGEQMSEESHRFLSRHWILVCLLAAPFKCGPVKCKPSVKYYASRYYLCQSEFVQQIEEV